MGSLDVCSTEDVVLALLDYLVDPLLPAKPSTQETPSPSQQQAVAKQVHAVVLLFNYYHRKQRPQLEFLGFESFCKLAVVLKPTLLTHMKLMQRSSDTELDNLENQLSITERMIMDACDISTSLHASKNIPSPEGWPISKVTVFLVDSRRENCLLLFGSITQGVWSVIEKDMDDSPSGMVEKHINKRKRITRKSMRDELGADETHCQQLAFSAVKETTDINETDLTILESHVVYSLSKEKTAARFYILQCTQSNNDGVIQVPVKDAINSLEGPLVQKCVSVWVTTAVVEYFHLLPYAGILSDWFSSLQDSTIESGNPSINNSKRTEKACDSEDIENGDGSHGKYDGVAEGLSNKTNKTYAESLKQNGKIQSCVDNFLDASDGFHNMDVEDCSAVCPQNEDKSKNISNMLHVDTQQTMMISSLEGDLNGSASGTSFKVVEVVDSMVGPCINELRGEKVATGNKIHDLTLSDQVEIIAGDRTLVAYQSNSKDLDKLQTIVASKENLLSQTALRVLLKKRDKLSLQQRNIEDEIAQCDRNIQTILSGGEDDLALKIESIIEGCNDVCLRSDYQIPSFQERNCHHNEDQRSPQYIKRKRLSEAVLNLQNPCQELDYICYENNWILPTYRVSPSDGGFQANVTMKGVEFECSSEGDLECNPHKARESAAQKVLAKLRSMASKPQSF